MNKICSASTVSNPLFCSCNSSLVPDGGRKLAEMPKHTGVGVGVIVGVGVTVEVAVGVSVRVGVAVSVGVGEGPKVAVAVLVAVGVLVAVLVGVAVFVGVGVMVGEGVFVGWSGRGVPSIDTSFTIVRREVDVIGNAGIFTRGTIGL